MARSTNRSLIDGLREIYRSSRFLGSCSFLLIAGISSVIPLSMLWLIQCFFLGTSIAPPFLHTVLTVWSVVEMIFLLYQSYLYAVIQNQAAIPHVTTTERDYIVSNALSNIKNLPHTLSKWFMGRPFEDLDRGSIIEWLAFAFYSKHADELNNDERKEINALIRRIEVEHRLNLTDDASAKKINCMKHILDPVRVIFRPLIYYVVTDTLLNGILATSIFYWRGYRFVRLGHLQFWTYRDEALDRKDEKDPIIFFHGIGSGLLMYQPFFVRLHREFASQRRIILVSMRCICMRYPSLNDIPNMSDTTDSVRLIIERYGFKQAVFIGHSYGTACLSWIVQRCPQYVSRLIFIDPICFALFEPYVVYNFVYRIPYKLGHLYMYYFVCRELGISYVISRHFWWTQNNLFIEQIPSHGNGTPSTFVLLSGRDCIVNVQLVKDYLIENNVEYYWAPNLSHGGFMHDEGSWEQVCRWIS